MMGTNSVVSWLIYKPLSFCNLLSLYNWATMDWFVVPDNRFNLSYWELY